jgi:hypothetical protein
MILTYGRMSITRIGKCQQYIISAPDNAAQLLMSHALSFMLDTSIFLH